MASSEIWGPYLFTDNAFLGIEADFSTDYLNLNEFIKQSEQATADAKKEDSKKPATNEPLPKNIFVNVNGSIGHLRYDRLRATDVQF